MRSEPRQVQAVQLDSLKGALRRTCVGVDASSMPRIEFLRRFGSQ